MLSNNFIYTKRTYKEGVVELFEQQIGNTDVKNATLEITALGVYEANIDGNKVGDMMFAPGYTYYPLHLNYQKYDITKMIKSTSTLRVYLGQGWYCGRFTHENKTQIYGDYPAVSWILTIEQNDGSVIVHTSTDFNVKAIDSNISYSGFYDGEIYQQNSYDILQPQIFEGNIPLHLEETTSHVKVQEEIFIKKITTNNGKTIIDFGQNFSGIIEVNTSLLYGKSIQIRHAEILNGDDELYTNNLRKAKAEINIIPNDSIGIYRPKFTYMGFRYIEITGVEYQDNMIRAFSIYNDLPKTGYFESGNKNINQLYSNQIWGQKSNYVEIPTDCPQRDERMGYTGDGHVFAHTGAYNFDVRKFWRKFLKDIRYSQIENTEDYVAPTIPAEGPAGIGFLNMLGWGNCVTIVPEMLYKHYGDESFLKEQYESIKSFVECEIRHLGENNLWIGINLGDWLMLGKDTQWMAQHNNPVSNSFIVNDLRILTETAKLFDKEDDYTRYSEYYNIVKKTYIKEFISQDGVMNDNYQGAYIMALKYVLDDGDLWNKVFDNLMLLINENGMDTGFFATEHILPLLIKGNKTNMAYNLLLQEECPGWMYQVNRGATTMWERWDAIKEDGSINEIKLTDDNMVSFNHYAFGSVGKFYYEHILGISQLEPGFKKIKIEPQFDIRLGYAQGIFKSISGDIKVNWKYIGEQIAVEIDTPSPTIVVFPNDEKYEIKAGKYKYII